MERNNVKMLITGAAGFIGAHLTKRILETGSNTFVIGLDNLNDYYDIRLKQDRLQMIRETSIKGGNKFEFIKGDISDKKTVDEIFGMYEPDIVVNLAAQAGVRYSITNPEAYMNSNITGFFNILEACRKIHDGDHGLRHLVYASSSSVYGMSRKVPYSVADKVDNPVSFYAATKKSNELMAHAYSALYGIPSTGLRFFTVYGPMGRPDMAYFGFADKMARGERIQVYNHGDMYRDFTYIDDIITGIINVIHNPPKENGEGVRYKIYNIGNNRPESLMYFIDTLEKCLMEEDIIRMPAEKEFLPMQQGDVYQTYADVDELVEDFGFRPATPLKEGLSRFVRWYKGYCFEKG